MSFQAIEQAFSKYGIYREPGLDSIWITHADILSQILSLSKMNNISVIQAGNSIEGRSIFRIKMGNGKIKILLWSQMHGNESTATKAIFDLINFLKSDDELTGFKNNLLDNLEINFVPMLNPDGAERFTRENAVNVDLNRDALSFQSPESRILQELKDEINPEFCFNLHDQNRYYSVGRTDFSPVLSFLAPPSGYNNPVNDARVKAIQVIVHLKKVLNKYIPNQIAKYSDDHEPRSFGDNFNRQESAVILVESGFVKNDPEKEKVREYNFISLLSALEAISSKSYTQCSTDDYSKIAENNEGRFFDLLLKGGVIRYGASEYRVDIGINRYEFPTEIVKKFYTKGIIAGIGDLSTFSAHEIVDCKGMTVCEGRILSNSFKNTDEITALDLEQHLREGVTTVLCKECNYMEEYSNTLYNIILRDNISSHEIKTGLPANLYLSNKNGVMYLVINGFLMQAPFNNKMIRNGLIFR
jgi:hypothetical protein